MDGFAYLAQVRAACDSFPDAIAFENSAGEAITYQQLGDASDALASYLLENVPGQIPCDDMKAIQQLPSSEEIDISPLKVVALRGHKQPFMLVVMIACMKAGICYAPLESSLPKQRVENILAQLQNPLLIEIEADSCANLDVKNLVSSDALTAICSIEHPATPDSKHAIQLEHPLYILFTSGSTGAPKGVVQPARTMEYSSRYFERFIPKDHSDSERLVFFNKTHFSFDMSLFDMAIALPHGHTMFSLEDEAEVSLAKTFEALATSNAALWISTPSYLNMCLADPSFDQNLMPKLDTVVVAGETLFKSTAEKLFDRFPHVRLFNSYGPTETEAVTDLVITKETLTHYDVIPIGTCSPYNEIQIVDPTTKEDRGFNDAGEICILGKTVAAGYFGREDLTEKSFAWRTDIEGDPARAYYTGDKGMIDQAGMVWFYGRYDDQVNLNGFRVELQEVEIAISSLDETIESCVTVVDKDVMSSYLIAHVVVKQGVEPNRATTKALKQQLSARLPHYMIPRIFKYYEELPKSINGKIDRKKLS